MFTGIIEDLGEIIAIEQDGENIRYSLRCSFCDTLKVDQSLAHNGVCLTVEAIQNGIYYVTAIKETLLRTNLAEWKVKDKVNLERCMLANGRFDGHIVQGHIDTVGICSAIEDENGSYAIEIQYNYPQITVEKGSVTLNGVSLTVVKSNPKSFTVHVIPYTYKHTTFQQIMVGDKINIEFDIIGKYVSRLLKK